MPPRAFRHAGTACLTCLVLLVARAPQPAICGAAEEQAELDNLWCRYGLAACSPKAHSASHPHQQEVGGTSEQAAEPEAASTRSGAAPAAALEASNINDDSLDLAATRLGVQVSMAAHQEQGAPGSSSIARLLHDVATSSSVSSSGGGGSTAAGTPASQDTAAGNSTAARNSITIGAGVTTSAGTSSGEALTRPSVSVAAGTAAGSSQPALSPALPVLRPVSGAAARAPAWALLLLGSSVAAAAVVQFWHCLPQRGVLQRPAEQAASCGTCKACRGLAALCRAATHIADVEATAPFTAASPADVKEMAGAATAAPCRGDHLADVAGAAPAALFKAACASDLEVVAGATSATPCKAAGPAVAPLTVGAVLAMPCKAAIPTSVAAMAGTSPAAPSKAFCTSDVLAVAGTAPAAARKAACPTDVHLQVAARAAATGAAEAVGFPQLQLQPVKVGSTPVPSEPSHVSSGGNGAAAEMPRHPANAGPPGSGISPYGQQPESPFGPTSYYDTDVLEGNDDAGGSLHKHLSVPATAEAVPAMAAAAAELSVDASVHARDLTCRAWVATPTSPRHHPSRRSSNYHNPLYTVPSSGEPSPGTIPSYGSMADEEAGGSRPSADWQGKQAARHAYLERDESEAGEGSFQLSATTAVASAPGTGSSVGAAGLAGRASTASLGGSSSGDPSPPVSPGKLLQQQGTQRKLTAAKSIKPLELLPADGADEEEKEQQQEQQQQPAQASSASVSGRVGRVHSTPASDNWLLRRPSAQPVVLSSRRPSLPPVVGVSRRPSLPQHHLPAQAGTASSTSGGRGLATATAHYPGGTGLQLLTAQQFKEEVRMGGLLGVGAAGCVYAAEWLGRRVAVKVMHPTSVDPTTFSREVEVMANVGQHPCIIGVMAACLEPPTVAVVQELAEMSLHDQLHQHHRRPQYGLLMQLAEDIAAALHHCHTLRPPVVHRDLSAKNVLLGADGRARLADFGLAATKRSTFLSDGKNGALGTAAYMSPEAMQAGQVTERCDVYSFGVLLWEMLSGRPAWEECGHPVQVIYTVGVERRRPPIPAGCPPPLAQLLKECWRHQAPLRPSFEEVLQRLRHMQSQDSFGAARPALLPPTSGTAAITVSVANTRSKAVVAAVMREARRAGSGTDAAKPAAMPTTSVTEQDKRSAGSQAGMVAQQKRRSSNQPVKIAFGRSVRE